MGNNIYADRFMKNKISQFLLHSQNQVDADDIGDTMKMMRQRGRN